MTNIRKTRIIRSFPPYPKGSVRNDCKFCMTPEGEKTCPYHGSDAEARWEQTQMRDPRA